MTLIDDISNSLGITEKKKRRQLSLISNSLSLVEEWISENDMDDIIQNADKNFILAVDKGTKLLIRMSNKLRNNHDDELMNDCLELAQHVLLLKSLLAYDAGFRWNLSKKDIFMSNKVEMHPYLNELATYDENTITAMVEEAIESTIHLSEKYSH